MRFNLIEKSLSQKPHFPFNSLYEIPIMVLDWVTFWLLMSFNSLYEIRTWVGGRKSTAYSSFNSLYEIRAEGGAIPPRPPHNLSILFMRFHPEEYQKKKEEDFQFSLWDSVFYPHRVNTHYEDFQFSLWDSLLTISSTGLMFMLSFNSLYEIQRNSLES